MKNDDATSAVSPGYSVGDKRSADTITAAQGDEDLYCTDKHIGMKVVVDPKDASLEYAPFSSILINGQPYE